MAAVLSSASTTGKQNPCGTDYQQLEGHCWERKPMAIHSCVLLFSHSAEYCFPGSSTGNMSWTAYSGSFNSSRKSVPRLRPLKVTRLLAASETSFACRREGSPIGEIRMAAHNWGDEPFIPWRWRWRISARKGNFLACSGLPTQKVTSCSGTATFSVCRPPL